jgi:hypothetical protein
LKVAIARSPDKPEFPAEPEVRPDFEKTFVMKRHFSGIAVRAFPRIVLTHLRSVA